MGGQPASNVWTILEYLRDNMASARIQDPANTNNILSDDLTDTEKRAVAAASHATRSRSSGGNVIW